MGKHMFTLPKQVLKYNYNKVEKSEHTVGGGTALCKLNSYFTFLVYMSYKALVLKVGSGDPQGSLREFQEVPS